MKFPLSEVFQH